MTVRALESDGIEQDAALLTLPVSQATPEAAALAEADQIRAGARRDAFLLYTSARQDAERLIDEARAEAAGIIETARIEAAELTAASRTAAEEAAARLLSIALAEQPVAAVVEEPQEDSVPERDGRSRYSVRSAKLPHLGDDAGRAALQAVSNLRGAFAGD